jgi:hypothetical protein
MFIDQVGVAQDYSHFVILEELGGHHRDLVRIPHVIAVTEENEVAGAFLDGALEVFANA